MIDREPRNAVSNGLIPSEENALNFTIKYE